MNYSQIIIVGNIGDVKDGTTTTGKKWCRLRVAVNKRIKRGDTWEVDTQWFTVSSWQEGLIEKLTKTGQKGRRVLVQGEPSIRVWEDDAGQKHEAFEVMVGPGDVVRFMDAQDQG